MKSLQKWQGWGYGSLKIMSRSIDDYLSFRRANHPRLVSGIDYVHASHATAI